MPAWWDRTADRPPSYTPLMRTRPALLRPGTLLGNETGLRAAYAAHGGELYRAARRSLGDDHLAEEAVQETFLRAWRAADRYDERLGSLRTWLFAILRNTVIDLARADAARPLRALRDPPAVAERPAEVDELDRALLAWQVEEALTRLSDDHRTVLVGVHLQGRSLAAVAAELRIPLGTVKSRAYYALRALRVVLEELGWTDEEPS
jgi:RNA polymerase sigma-70 factor, ECF subfamily